MTARPSPSRQSPAPARGLPLERLWREASDFDRADADLGAMLAPLIGAGAFVDVLPPPWGSALATDRGQTEVLFHTLRAIGGANLSAGRLYEGHVNAVRLVFAHGRSDQKDAFARAVAAGAVSGVWNAEAPPGLAIRRDGAGFRLDGGKIHCSGAGFLTAPLVTARDEDGGVVMVVSPELAAATVDLSPWRMRGMRATATGAVAFDGLGLPPSAVVGMTGDYYRAPAFRGGAWRCCAVQLGGVERIGYLLRQGLRDRGRGADPHQRARVAAAAAAARVASLVVLAAARAVESETVAPETAEAEANIARMTVERAAAEVMELTERSLGLAAFAEIEPVERVARDLSTYLRQPFADRVADDVGAHFLDSDPGVHPGAPA